MTETLAQLWINLGVKSTVRKDISGVTSELSAVERVAGGATKTFSSVGSALATVGTAAIVTGTAVGVGLVAGAYKGVTAFKTFEQSVANAASVTGKTGEAFNQAKQNISAVAQELGQKTVFSSSQAADAMYNLASAGYDVSAMASSDLVPVLNLASGTQYDLAQTTGMVVSTLSQFGLGFDSASRVTDVFAKAIGSSQATMEKLAYSMNYVGPLANSMGMSVEEVTAALSQLYNAGLKGEQAGTGLRGVFASLLSPSNDAAAAIESMGLSLEQVNPQTVKFTDIVQLLADSGLDANKAIQIFGREAAPAILALTSTSGDLKTLTSELQNAGGAAQTMADQQLDTLSGSLEALSGSIENLFINLGQALAPTIRDVAKYLDEIMPAIQDVVVGIVTVFISFVSKLGKSVSSIKAIGSTIIDVFNNVFNVVAGSGSGIASSAASIINGIMSRIAGVVIEVAPLIQNAIIGVINFVKMLVSGLAPTWDNLKTITTGLINTFKAFFSGLAGPDSKNAANAISTTVNTITGVLAKLSAVVTGALISVAPTVKNIISNIVNAVKDLIPKLSTVWDSIKKKFTELKPVLENAIKALDPVWAKLKTGFSIAVDTFKSFIISLGPTWDNIKSIWKDLPTIFRSGLDALTPVWTFLKAIFDTGANIFKDFVKNLTPTWDNLKSAWDSTKTIWSTIKDTVSPAISAFLKALGGTEASEAAGVGEALAGIINKLSGYLAKFLKYLADNPKIVKLAVAITGVASAFVTLVPIVSGIIGAFGLLNAALAPVGYAIGYLAGTLLPLLLTPIGLIGAAVVLLAIAWKENWFGIQDKAKAVWEWLKTSASKLYTDLKTAYANILASGETLKTQFSNAWNSLVTLYNSVKTAIISVATGIYNGLVSVYNTIVSAVTTLYNSWNTGWTNIKTALATITALIISTLQNWYSEVQTKFNTVKTAILNFYNDWVSRWNFIKTTLSEAKDFIINKLQSWYNDAVSKFNNVKAAIATFYSDWKTAWTNIYTYIVTKVTEIIDRVKEIPTKIKDTLKNTNLYQAGVNFVTNLKNGVMDTLTGLYDSAVKKVKEIMSVLSKGDSSSNSSAKKTGSSSGTTLNKALSDSIASSSPSVAKAFDTVMKSVDKFIPHSPAKEGPFKKLPNWDAVFLDPVLASVKKMKGVMESLDSPLIGLNSQKPPSSIASQSSVSTSNHYSGDTISISIGAVNNQADVDYLLKQLETRSKQKGMQRGYLL